MLRNAHGDARGDAYVLPHFDELRCDNLQSLTSSFERIERSLKVSKLNTLSKILVWIKHGSTPSLENVCDSCRLHQTG